jgi:hypothetical protein
MQFAFARRAAEAREAFEALAARRDPPDAEPWLEHLQGSAS